MRKLTFFWGFVTDSGSRLSAFCYLDFDGFKAIARFVLTAILKLAWMEILTMRGQEALNAKHSQPH